MKVAFICVHNSCRSQMAEALGKHLASDAFESYSAGTESVPQINPDAVRIMKQLYGIDMSAQYSKLINEIPSVDLAISMGCNVSCPYIGREFDENWGLEDPTGRNDEEFIRTAREIEKRILLLRDRILHEKLKEGFPADEIGRPEKLKEGRPADESGRLEKEIRTYDFLDSLGIHYYRVDHEAAMTMEACEAIDDILQATICKNLFLCNRQETDFYLLLMPGEKKFKTKDLSKQLGVARLSFAKEEYMEEFLDITPGSLSILGLMNDKDHRVRLCIDEDILHGEEIGCHPCINTSSLKFRTRDLVEKIIPAMGHEPTIVNLPVYTEE